MDDKAKAGVLILVDQSRNLGSIYVVPRINQRNGLIEYFSIYFDVPQQLWHALLQEYIKYCRYVFQNETIPNQVAQYPTALPKSSTLILNIQIHPYLAFTYNFAYV